MAIRQYTCGDRAGVRRIYGEDLYGRPTLSRRYPRYTEYLADAMSYYTDYEPESLFVAVVGHEVVGALLGAIDTERCERLTNKHIRPLLRWRCLRGEYGLPRWLLYDLITQVVGWGVARPVVNLGQYPAHLHIGVLEAWQRQGIGARLMDAFTGYLRDRRTLGFHLYASEYHWKGVVFYHKLGLDVLGRFRWRFHDGTRLKTVTETIFGRALGG